MDNIPPTQVDIFNKIFPADALKMLFCFFTCTPFPEGKSQLDTLSVRKLNSSSNPEGSPGNWMVILSGHFAFPLVDSLRLSGLYISQFCKMFFFAHGKKTITVFIKSPDLLWKCMDNCRALTSGGSKVSLFVNQANQTSQLVDKVCLAQKVQVAMVGFHEKKSSDFHHETYLLCKDGLANCCFSLVDFLDRGCLNKGKKFFFMGF